MNPKKISLGGKIEIVSKINDLKKNLSLVYTPGVAEVVMEVIKNPEKVNDYTWKKKTIAIITDGSAILGLGNQGPLAALPVMEAKAVLFKKLADLNAVPIVLASQDPFKTIETIKNLAPSFGGINLEDIAAPNCFLIKEKLKKELNVPVFHDDQYGTAIAVLAGLINATKIVKKNLKKTKIVISGAGAAGIATAKLLLKFGAKNIVLFDSKGPLFKGRKEGMNFAKIKIAQKTNPKKFQGTLKEALKGADIFIGLSSGNLLNYFDIEKMNKNAIVFALANPVPEITPREALKGGAKIVATGRSDYPNQINNALVFPGIFKGAISSSTYLITDELKLKAAQALASTIKKPTISRIIPKVTDKIAVEKVASIFN